MSINKENVKDIKLIDKIVDGTLDIAYDNSISGLTSTNLKHALDEVKALATTPDVTTSLALVGNTLTYLDEQNNSTNIDLAKYLDNTDKFVVSGTVSGNNLVLTLNDASTININVSSLLDNTDKFVVSGSVSQNTLTLVLNDSSTVAINIAGIQNTTVDTTKIQFALTGPSSPLTVGGLAWNVDETTLDLVLNGATLQIGQEQLIKVRNNTGSTIQNGAVLMATGSIGNSTRITVAPHNGQQAYAKYIVGIATETIANDADGFCTTFGKVRQINTSGSSVGETWTDGTVLYVKPNGSGTLTNVVPDTTQLSMPIAFVLNAHATNGTLFVRVLPFDEHDFIPHTQTMINDAINALINSAPGALDTLKELAMALGNDANFATTVTNSLALKANTSSLATVATTGSYNDLINKPILGSLAALNSVSASTLTGSTLATGITSSSLTSVGILSSMRVNGLSNLGTDTFVKSSFGNGDLALDNGTTDTPATLFYYANNKNWGIDSWFDPGASKQILRFVTDLNETGGTVRASLDNTGKFTATSFVGNGSALTNIGAPSISDGAITSTKLGSNGIFLTQFAGRTSQHSLGGDSGWVDHISMTITPSRQCHVLIIYGGSQSYESGAVQGFARILVDGVAVGYNQAVAHQSTANSAGGGMCMWDKRDITAGNHTITVQLRNSIGGTTWITPYWTTDGNTANTLGVIYYG